MRFIDEAEITVIAGHGGSGSVSFRRETMEPRGGPDGGDGGKGGDILMEATANLSTLLDFRYRKIHEAQNGHYGMGKRKAGPDGQDILIKVPVGTIVRDADTGEELFDFTEATEKPVLICKGGRGGKGNAHFATATFQAPKFCQPGEPGESKKLKLELKLLADVGLLGFPNVGKSSLIAAISAARPKIADYEFTTLVPNLGVVKLDEERKFVVADVPGLIEGAHEGVGLGIQFLKHLERTKIYLHIIDPASGRDPERDYAIIHKELKAFNPDLENHREVVVFNKMDALQDEEQLHKLEVFCNKLKLDGKPFVKISVATREGIKELMNLTSQELFQKQGKLSPHDNRALH